MSDQQAHDVTLRLLDDLAARLPESRARLIRERRETMLRLLSVQDEASARSTAQDLLKDALQVR